MSRKTDLEQHIHASYDLIRDYEAIIQTSDRPEEKARARRVIGEQRALIEGYLAEYHRLVGGALPADIAEMAAILPPSTVSPPAPPTAPSTVMTIIGDGNVVGDHSTSTVLKDSPGDGAAPATTAALRQLLQRLDAVQIESLCLDHFPEVYDRFSRGLQRDEMINLLLNHCRQKPGEAARLSAELARREQQAAGNRASGRKIAVAGGIHAGRDVIMGDQVNLKADEPDKTPPRPVTSAPRGKVDFAIITIREDEYEAVLRRFISTPRYVGERRYVVGEVKLEGSDYYTVAIARSTDPGQGPAQDLARDMIEQLAPEWLLVVGIAGGVPDDDFTLGDVVVAKRLLDFSVRATIENEPPEYDVRGWAHPAVEWTCAALPAERGRIEGQWNSPEAIGMPRPGVQLDQEQFYGEEAWRQKVERSLQRHFSAPRWPRFTTAVIAATEELVKSPTLVQQWMQDARSMRAVEMELAGVYQAARRGKEFYPVLAIRGISDIVGFKRDPAWTAYACHSAAAFAYALVKSGFIKPSRASQAGTALGQSPGESGEPDEPDEEE